MFKVKTSRLEEWFAVDSGRRDVARRAGTAGHRPVGAAGDRPIGAVIRTGERHQGVGVRSEHRAGPGPLAAPARGRGDRGGAGIRAASRWAGGEEWPADLIERAINGVELPDYAGCRTPGLGRTTDDLIGHAVDHRLRRAEPAVADPGTTAAPRSRVVPSGIYRPHHT
jgi:hypothetical protein